MASNLYYRWGQDFLEAGKKQLAGDTVQEATSDEVKDLRSENSKKWSLRSGQEPCAQKSLMGHSWRAGRFVRRIASEKLEIIRLVEETDLPVRATLCPLGVPRSTFYGLVPQGSRRWLRWSP